MMDTIKIVQEAAMRAAEAGPLKSSPELLALMRKVAMKIIMDVETGVTFLDIDNQLKLEPEFTRKMFEEFMESETSINEDDQIVALSLFFRIKYYNAGVK